MTGEQITVSFGVATVVICVMTALRRSAHGLGWLGLITGIGWCYGTWVAYNFVPTAEQRLLAIGDALQCVPMLWLIRRYKLSPIAFWGITIAFVSMFGMHVSMLLHESDAAPNYTRYLNYAYVIQLIMLVEAGWHDRIVAFVRYGMRSLFSRNRHRLSGGF